MRLSWWDDKRWVLAFDVLFAAGLTVLPFLESEHRRLSWWVVGVSVLIAASLIVRRRFPLIAVAGTPLSLFFTPSINVMVASYTVASKRGLRRQSLVGAAVSVAVIVVWPAPHRRHIGWVEVVATCGLFVGVPMLLGLWVFQRRALLVALRDRAEQAERERDLRAERVVVAERRRIAREMHDVVAHRVSAIALQSGALTMTAPDEHTEQVAEVIRRTSTAALTELREILQVLRDEQSGEPGHVAPSLGAVPVLVSDAAATGLAVSLELPDPVPEVAPAVGRAAYRVVQEALTNAAKHAPGEDVAVVITADPEELVVEILNRRAAPEAAAPGAGPETGRRTTAEAAAGRGAAPGGMPGAGYGLLGMRERVTLAGGRLEAGWVGEVFRVRAVLAVKAAE